MQLALRIGCDDNWFHENPSMLNPSKKTNPAWGYFSGLAAAAIWGGMYVVSKVVMEVIPPFALIVTRLILGILTLGCIVLVRKGWKVSRRQFWQILGVGVVGYGISLGFQFVGTNLSTATNGALVTSATPAFVLLFASLLLAEQVTTRRLLALGIATAGVAAVIDPRHAALSPAFFLGNICLVAAALTWALYSVLIRKVTRDTDVLTTTLIAFIGGLPICLPLSGWEALTQGFGVISLGVVGGILFLGVISTALAMYLWNTAFAVLDAGAASLTFFAQPVVGTLLSVLFLNEHITPLFVIGGVLIGIALLVSNKA
jgi:drug/metabolite transporter (DMT)-like permease